MLLEHNQSFSYAFNTSKVGRLNNGFSYRWSGMTNKWCGDVCLLEISNSLAYSCLNIPCACAPIDMCQFQQMVTACGQVAGTL